MCVQEPTDDRGPLEVDLLLMGVSHLIRELGTKLRSSTQTVVVHVLLLIRHLSSSWLNSGHQQFRLPIICMFRTTPYKETQVSTEKCILTLLLPVRSFKKHKPQIIDNVQQQSNPLGQNHQRHSALRAMRWMNSENFFGHQSATKNITERRVCVCCGLYVQCPHGLKCLNTWSPAGCTIL